MARRRTVLTIPIPDGGVEVADVLAVLTGVAPSYDLARIEVQGTREGENFLVLTAGRRRLRPGFLGAEPLPCIEEDAAPAEEVEPGWPETMNTILGGIGGIGGIGGVGRPVRVGGHIDEPDGAEWPGVATSG